MSAPYVTLPQIIRNDANLYEANLVTYFRTIFQNAQNLSKPYHNFRHMFHVVYLCYQACLFYKGRMSKRKMRNLLIAAMFHDFDHCGMLGHDDLNIQRALRGLRKHILHRDAEHLTDIGTLIETTEYPYKIDSDKISLSGQILRDADLSQALSPAWIQQVVFGLAGEWNKQPIEILRMQPGFHSNLKYSTRWAISLFGGGDVDRKVQEVTELVQLLESTVT